MGKHEDFHWDNVRSVDGMDTIGAKAVSVV